MSQRLPQPGDRVRMSEEAKRAGINRNRKPPYTGLVVGRRGHLVKVHMDGRRLPTEFHIDFWEVDAE